jgi:hypothetical protein
MIPTSKYFKRRYFLKTVETVDFNEIQRFLFSKKADIILAIKACV